MPVVSLAPTEALAFTSIKSWLVSTTGIGPMKNVSPGPLIFVIWIGFSSHEPLPSTVAVTDASASAVALSCALSRPCSSDQSP